MTTTDRPNRDPPPPAGGRYHAPMAIKPERIYPLALALYHGQPKADHVKTAAEDVWWDETEAQMAAITARGGQVELPYDDAAVPDDHLQHLYHTQPTAPKG